MNAKLLLCLAALPAAVDALGEFHAEEVKTTCPTLVPLRLNQTNTAGSLMSTGTVAVLDSDYQGSDKPAVIDDRVESSISAVTPFLSSDPMNRSRAAASGKGIRKVAS